MDPSMISLRCDEKRPWTMEPVYPAKKLRSNIPRRKRIPDVPIIGFTLSGYFVSEEDSESSSSCFSSEISNDISNEFRGHPKRPRSSRTFRLSKSIGRFQWNSSSDPFRPITRFYAKRMNEMRSQGFAVGVDRSVDPISGSAIVSKRSEPAESDGNAITISGVSEMSTTLPEDNLKVRKNTNKSITKVLDVSESSCLQTEVSEANVKLILGTSTAGASELLFKGDTAIRGEKTHDLDLESDLACPEQLFDDEECSAYSACNERTLSELESDLFDGLYKGDSSEISLSDIIESPEDFSERSRDNSIPSVAFSLLQQLWQQFNPSSFHSESNVKFQVLNELSDELVFVRFPDKDIEESYQVFRSRERKEIALHDYSDGYYGKTNFGDLILGQRLVMVNWMLEHCQAMEHQDETLFLGVNLMDRVLSRGYFQTERNLQLLGIACVTLATRLEENQPFNSVRQKSFKVGNNFYKRCDVVSMEWLVLEVLSFQCFLPTTHSFLWFYMKAARATAKVEDLCRHLAILTLLDHGILCFWPSTVAAGLVILACLATNNDSYCDVVLETHVRSKTDDLPECIQSLDWLVKYASMGFEN
ncbi:cyclin-SDS-like [Phalaenopsis equestris]|uniref:cyclin-SDS-like n=1 Tax=Phalaenopsis equestris TaxID=78828 RepID=UPI0009E2B124|nr:cyclin-SDS-like [Phalaenopsis equestris]XP_020582899.1 cyclin-SDS-like [Phalaenopsis equestris]